jgi:hypothetical protein
MVRAEWILIPLVFLNMAILIFEIFFNLLSGVRSLL